MHVSTLNWLLSNGCWWSEKGPSFSWQQAKLTEKVTHYQSRYITFVTFHYGSAATDAEAPQSQLKTESRIYRLCWSDFSSPLCLLKDPLYFNQFNNKMTKILQIANWTWIHDHENVSFQRLSYFAVDASDFSVKSIVSVLYVHCSLSITYVQAEYRTTNHL